MGGHELNELVILDDTSGEGGLAAMLAELIASNVREDAYRSKLLRGLRGSVEIIAEEGSDRTVATLRFDGERLFVSSTSCKQPDLMVRASYEDILALSKVPLCPFTHLPKPLARKTIELLLWLLRGRITVQGAIFHPRLAITLLALVSVSD